jgi:hypothetical protein
MSTIQFPTGVPNGTTFTAENGVTYTYDSSGGGGWTANTSEGLNDRFVNADGDTMTGDLTVPSLNGGQLAGFRNQIINGAFTVWQRGDGPWNTDLEYTADRWRKNSNSGLGVNFTKYTTLANLPEGFIAGIRCVVNSSGDTSGGCLQPIELPGVGVAGPFIQNSKWTLSLWCDQDITGTTATAKFGTTNTGTSVNASTIGTFVSTGETSNSFTRYFLNIDIGSAVPDATNTQFEISLTMHSQLGVTCIYTGVQLEPGPVATPFEQRPIGTELALCQRYYQTVATQGVIGNYNSSSSNTIFTIPGTAMRTDATTQGNVSVSTGRYQSSGGTSVGVTSISTTSNGFRVLIARENSTNSFAPVTLCNSTLSFDAEL